MQRHRSTDQVRRGYDPTKVMGQRLSDKLREHFYKVRVQTPERAERDKKLDGHRLLARLGSLTE